MACALRVVLGHSLTKMRRVMREAVGSGFACCIVVLDAAGGDSAAEMKASSLERAPSNRAEAKASQNAREPTHPQDSESRANAERHDYDGGDSANTGLTTQRCATELNGGLVPCHNTAS